MVGADKQFAAQILIGIFDAGDFPADLAIRIQTQRHRPLIGDAGGFINATATVADDDDLIGTQGFLATFEQFRHRVMRRGIEEDNFRHQRGQFLTQCITGPVGVEQFGL